MTPADVTTLQTRLAHAGYDPGPQDGAIGPKSYTALFSYMARRDLGDRGAALGKGAAAHFPAYEIDTPLRLAHFMAQAAHETGGFRYLREIWGPTPAQSRYEGRLDLGNTHPGDGRLYMGRGIFQLTGRANYERYGTKLGIDLLNHPEIAEEPGTAVLTACAFWKDKGLSALADADNIVAITHRINGGENGLAERKAALVMAKAVLL